MQAMAVAGGIAGGVVMLGNAAIRLAEKVIAKKNGNGSEAMRADVRHLVRSIDGFKTSHVTLKELAQEQVLSNRKFHTQFAVFLERFGTHCIHMEDKE